MVIDIEIFGDKDQTQLGPDPCRVQAFDMESLSKGFDLAEIRSMSRQSRVLKYLARKINNLNLPESDPDRRGVYLVANEGEMHLNFINSFFNSAGQDHLTRFRSVPPKHWISLCTSMITAQLAIESQSRGNCVSVFLDRNGIATILEELKLDFSYGRIQSAFVGFVFGGICPMNKTKSTSHIQEIGYLAFVTNPSDSELSTLHEKLNTLFRKIGLEDD